MCIKCMLELYFAVKIAGIVQKYETYYAKHKFDILFFSRYYRFSLIILHAYDRVQ